MPTHTTITIIVVNLYIRRIRDIMPLESWRPHDFRHSLSTGASSELCVMSQVVEKILSHELGGLLAVYNKHTSLETKEFQRVNRELSQN